MFYTSRCCSRGGGLGNTTWIQIDTEEKQPQKAQALHIHTACKALTRRQQASKHTSDSGGLLWIVGKHKRNPHIYASINQFQYTETKSSVSMITAEVNYKFELSFHSVTEQPRNLINFLCWLDDRSYSEWLMAKRCNWVIQILMRTTFFCHGGYLGKV